MLKICTQSLELLSTVRPFSTFSKCIHLAQCFQRTLKVLPFRQSHLAIMKSLTNHERLQSSHLFTSFNYLRFICLFIDNKRMQ